MRLLTIGIACVLLLLLGAPGAEGHGVAILQAEPDLPISTQFGHPVRYKGGPLDNNADAHLWNDQGGLIIYDYPTVIVPVASPFCSGGLGTGTCMFSTSFDLLGEGGNDVLKLHIGPDYPQDDPLFYQPPGIDGGAGNDYIILTGGKGYVYCGPGSDRADVSPSVVVNEDCEVVNYI